VGEGANNMHVISRKLNPDPESWKHHHVLDPRNRTLVAPTAPNVCS
jgi:hypothetical protein